MDWNSTDITGIPIQLSWFDFRFFALHYTNVNIFCFRTCFVLSKHFIPNYFQLARPWTYDKIPQDPGFEGEPT
ncbi:hypothetical protein CMK16_04080 [Candidatus Poribacteria bacterium]|nr:hypothetical protein [Candidatus Poribacteria bacterium]